MSNFTNVSALNKIFGNQKGDLSQTDWEKATKQLYLIQEEMDELVQGIKEHDITEVRDAIADVLVTTYGMAHLLGIDADADMDEVQSSNMSKLCKNEQEVDDTLTYYKNTIGIDVYAGGDFPQAFIKSSKDQEGKDGKFYPEHKFLKNVNWHEPNLS